MNVDWPYVSDGVRRDEFAESLRLPIIDTSHPRWCYITAVMGESELYRTVRPTNDELLVVASFHQEYIDYWYRESYKLKMAERPFDIDGGANGRILAKYADGGWAYRQCSWIYGPTFVPSREDKASLVAVMDRAHSIGDKVMDRWLAWKDEHSDIFGEVKS